MPPSQRLSTNLPTTPSVNSVVSSPDIAGRTSPLNLPERRDCWTPAGISTRLIGEARDVLRRAAEVFSWVLREVATNIVRHSDATRCVIRLDASAEESVLTVTNDGIREVRSRRFGIGLNDDGARDVANVPGFRTGRVEWEARRAGRGAQRGAEWRYLCTDCPGAHDRWGSRSGRRSSW